MNFLARSDGGEKPVFQMTAMVDMVFILLTFFVMASQFAMPEKDVSMGAGEAVLADGASAEDYPSEITVRLRRAGSQMSVTVAESVLADLRDLTGKLAEINMPEIEVRLLADPELTVAEVAAALDAVLASPMKKVSVAELESAVAAAPVAGRVQP